MTGERPGHPAGKSTAPRSAANGLKVLLLLVIGGAIVVWLGRDVRGDLVSRLRGVQVGWLGIALLSLGAAVMAAGERWRAVMVSLGHRLPFGVAFRAMASAWPAAIVAPSKSNDLLRAHALRDRVPVRVTVVSVVVERVIDVSSLCALAAIGAGAKGQVALSASALLAAAGLPIAVGFLAAVGASGPLAGTRLGEALQKLRAVIGDLPSRSRALVGVAFWSGLTWLANVTLLYGLLQAFDGKVGFGDALALWPLALFVGLAPITFGGLGTRDAAFIWLLERFADSPPDRAGALSATVGYAVLTTGLLALVGLPFMVSAWSRRGSGGVADPPPGPG